MRDKVHIEERNGREVKYSAQEWECHRQYQEAEGAAYYPC